MAEARKNEMNYTRNAVGLTWDGCREPVVEGVLAYHERVMGIRFPDDLRAVLALCHGGTPMERSDFDFVHPELGELGSCVGALVVLDPDDTDGLLAIWRELQAYQDVPGEIVPFAMDGGGDYMCLDYRDNPTNPAVVYWAHEAEPENSLVFLAGSFSEFLSMLTPPELPPDD